MIMVNLFRICKSPQKKKKKEKKRKKAKEKRIMNRFIGVVMMIHPIYVEKV